MSKKYQKLDHREHILKRPNMYIGSIEKDTYKTWVFSSNGMTKKEITYVPGLYKIFDEILVNAIDHSVRMKTKKDKGEDVNLVKNIKVSIDKSTGYIEVLNDGDGIDVEIHEEQKVYVPELIFGHLLTSSNYDDTEEKIIGGQNGLGAKISSVFSKSFFIETVDHNRRKIYKQEFTNNMSEKTKPDVKACAKKPYTLVRFLPDYERFGLKGLTDDMYDMMVKRVYDTCAVTDSDVNIYLNGEKLEYKNFEKYVNMFLGDDKQEIVRVYEKIDDRWEVIVAMSKTGTFEHISFVNGIWTIRGGKHVEYITNQLTKKLVDMASKKKKDTTIKPQYIKDNLFVFIKSTIVNPAFDSQTKETLTTPYSKFGSKPELSDKFVEKVYKSGIIEEALRIGDAMDNKSIKKTDGKKRTVLRGLPKLEDANWAGTAKSKECTLILTEGDSSASMAIAGISEIGRDKYGVFPLKGKILNVKDQAVKKISDNEEIANLKKILGLESGKEYKTLDDLRYGKIMIMTDQDSVSGDTPLLLRLNGQVHIKTIDDISYDTWESNINGKEYSTTKYQVWTEKGWTNIKHVMRHKVTKKMFRVLTHTGVVDVTEDHSLLDDKANKISPKDLSINNRLLHSFPRFSSIDIKIDDLSNMQVRELWQIASTLRIQYYQLKKKSELLTEIQQVLEAPSITLETHSCSITEKEAWTMGMFFADGSCNHNGKVPYWNISNCDMSYLNQAMDTMKSTYPDIKFRIYEDTSHVKNGYRPCYKLSNSQIVNKHFFEKYRTLFYDKDKKKRVPSEVLNAPLAVRQAFFDGYYAGDGSKGNMRKGLLGEVRFDVDGKIGAHGLYYLCRSLGYEVSINIRQDKPNVYRLNLTKGHQQDDPMRVKKMWQLDVKDQYVYDLETENHHFQAGIGQMIVHNTDGFHIRGLLFNMFHTLWPSLIANNQFITSMLTPIVKVSHNTEVISFYNLTDYQNWLKTTDEGKGWTIKYYKGLGTSTAEEAKQYFKELKQVQYIYHKDLSDERLDLAFNKKKADERKDWIGAYDRQNILDYKNPQVPYEDFVDKELIHFSNYDVERSIPNLCDGLKVSQRKILFSCFKKNLTSKEIKVAQLAGYVSENAAYHHGEASLQSAIINLAQNFVGSNNINILKPNGQFGTRRCGGKDAGSPRYIYTLLNPITSIIYPKVDHEILTYLNDDGLDVEPEYFMPIIPMVLVNGALGIGTGFSTNVPCYNPKDIVAVLRMLLKGESVSDMELTPWYKGFKGVIEKKDDDKFVSRGRFHKITATKVEITELPVGVWTQDFKETLESYMDAHNELRNYESHYTDTDIRFVLHFASGAVTDQYLTVESNGYTKLENELKLVSSKMLGTTNMYLFNSKCQIQKYDTAIDIIKEFYNVRLGYYNKRKEHMLAKLSYDIDLLDNKLRFIREVVAENILVHKMKKVQLEERLNKDGYKQHEGKYDYILRIPVYNLTIDKIEDLEAEKAKADAELQRVKDLDVKVWWTDDLQEFSKVYDEFLAEVFHKSKGATKPKK